MEGKNKAYIVAENHGAVVGAAHARAAGVARRGTAVSRDAVQVVEALVALGTELAHHCAKVTVYVRLLPLFHAAAVGQALSSHALGVLGKVPRVVRRVLLEDGLVDGFGRAHDGDVGAARREGADKLHVGHRGVLLSRDVGGGPHTEFSSCRGGEGRAQVAKDGEGGDEGDLHCCRCGFEDLVKLVVIDEGNESRSKVSTQLSASLYMVVVDPLLLSPSTSQSLIADLAGSHVMFTSLG